MGSTRLTSDLLKHPRSAGLGGPCVSLMIGCPGGGNEIRLKTTPDATTDCMPPTSLRLRLILILIHHHHPHQSKSQVRSNTPSPEKLRQIYKVTNQEITTDISHSRMFCSKSDYLAQQLKSIFFPLSSIKVFFFSIYFLLKNHLESLPDCQNTFCT